MEEFVAIASLLVTSWNVLPLRSDNEPAEFTHHTDRVAISLLASIIVQGFLLASLPLFAMSISLPGLMALFALFVYRASRGRSGLSDRVRLSSNSDTRDVCGASSASTLKSG